MTEEKKKVMIVKPEEAGKDPMLIVKTDPAQPKSEEKKDG